MNYYLTNKYCPMEDNRFSRPDFQSAGDPSCFNSDNSIDEVYVGDLLWAVDSPEGLLNTIVTYLPNSIYDGTKVYFEHINIYEFASSISYGDFSIEEVNSGLFSRGYKRVLDVDSTCELLADCGFVVESIDVDGGKFLITCGVE